MFGDGPYDQLLFAGSDEPRWKNLLELGAHHLSKIDSSERAFAQRRGTFILRRPSASYARLVSCLPQAQGASGAFRRISMIVSLHDWTRAKPRLIRIPALSTASPLQRIWFKAWSECVLQRRLNPYRHGAIYRFHGLVRKTPLILANECTFRPVQVGKSHDKIAISALCIFVIDFESFWAKTSLSKLSTSLI